MVNYVYVVNWNECDDEDRFETYKEAREFVDQQWEKEDPRYVTPFITEVETVSQDDGTEIRTGDDKIVWSYDSKEPAPGELRQNKLVYVPEDEYEPNTESDFDVYDVFNVTEKEPQPDMGDPYGGKTLWDFEEALSALNEADENFGECQICHEEFPKDELVKEGTKFVCKECAGNLTEDTLTEKGLFDGKQRLEKHLAKFGTQYKIWDPKNPGTKKTAPNLKSAEGVAKQMSAGNKTAIIGISKNDEAGVYQDTQLARFVNSRLQSDNYNNLKGIFKGAKGINAEIGTEEDAPAEEAPKLDIKNAQGQPVVINTTDDLKNNTLSEDELTQIASAFNQMIAKYTGITLDKNQLSKFAQLIKGSMETTFGKDVFLDKSEEQEAEQAVAAAEKATEQGEQAQQEQPEEKQSAAEATAQKQEEPKEEAPAENSREEKPAEEKPAENASSENTNSEEAPASEAPAEEAPAEAPAAENTKEEAPKEEAPNSKEAPKEDSGKKEESLKVNGDMLHEDLDQDLANWNEYVDYLKKMIEQEEKALEKAGDNDLVKKAIQRRIDAFKQDLEDALPNIVKSDEPEISEISKEEPVTEEPVKESKKTKKLKEAYDPDEFKRYMAAAKKLGIETGADLVKFSEAHGGVKDKELLKVMEEEANKQE